jgi:diguanylate cyclase (GGDEF)-like protein/PAS domain S-box-containing protein
VNGSFSSRLGRLLRRRWRAGRVGVDDGQLLRCLLEAAPESVYFKDEQSRFLRVSGAMAERWNATAEELIGRSDREYLPAAVAARTARDEQRVMRSGEPLFEQDECYVGALGEEQFLETWKLPLRDRAGRVVGTFGMTRDVTRRKQAEQAVAEARERLAEQARQNEHLALHDALTGLANRTLFRDRIEQATGRFERSGECFAVVMMDLDRFKEINDSLGHQAGDAVLQALAERLTRAVRASDTIARLGGDEFGLLLPGVAQRHQVRGLLGKLERALEPPLELPELALAVEASLGIALCPADGEDAETLLRHADVALYEAKRKGSGHAFYDAGSDASDAARLGLVGELRAALARGDLVLHYQPQLTLETGEVCAVEALVRWQHPERGLLLPDEFVPAAEQTGLMKPLTLYVLEEALRQSRRWLDAGRALPIAVNLSPRNLLDPTLPEQISELLERHAVEPSLLHLEITESAMLAEPTRSQQVLERLHALGVQLSLDDFGTGYSSLSHLTQLPLSEIKIDRSFVARLRDQERMQAIVRATSILAASLGLAVVAEGIEDEETFAELRALGCSHGQGFHLGPPLPAAALEELIRGRGESRPSANGQRRVA